MTNTIDSVIDIDIDLQNDDYIINNTLSIIKDKINNIDIRPSTIHLVLKYVMEHIEKTPIKGVKQKHLTLKVIRELIIDLTNGEDERILLLLIDDGTIGNLIDLIVDVSKGKIDINNVIDTAQITYSCLPHFCCKPKKK